MKVATGGLEPEILAEILTRIDENLDLRARLDSEESRVGASDAPPSERPPEPRLVEFEHRLHLLRTWNAPSFVIKGNNLQNLLKRALNVVIGVFGYKQARFNQFLLDSLLLLPPSVGASPGLVQEVNQATQRESELRGRLEELETGVRSGLAEIRATTSRRLEGLGARLADFDSGANHRAEEGITRLAGRLDDLATQLTGRVDDLAAQLTGRVDDLAAQLTGRVDSIEAKADAPRSSEAVDELRSRFAALAEGLEGQRRWVEHVVLSEEQLARRLDDLVRTSGASRGAASGTGFALDLTAYRRILAAGLEGLRVAIGAGPEDPDTASWIAIERKESPHPGCLPVDIAHLPFAAESLEELRVGQISSAVGELADRLLPHWYRLLRHGGALHVFFLDWDAILGAHATGSTDAAALWRRAFGTAEPSLVVPADVLRDLVERAGFCNLEMIGPDPGAMGRTLRAHRP